ncbi:MAG TPA: glycosyltransferase [Chitinophagaceae bacterium]|nr:glycosyltransferase [Chitinophagaceae bacterium]
MKILFIIDNLSSGGKERRLVELMKGLKGSLEVEFELALMSKDIHYKEIFDLGINIHYLIRKTKKDLRIFRTLYSLCKKFRPDIIHCWDSMSATYSFPVCKMLHIKLINGMVVDSPVRQNIFNTPWLRARLSFPFSHIIVGNSLAGLKAYRAPKFKSRCVYNGFNFERVKAGTSPDNLREKFKIQSAYVVIMVGEFSNRKDYTSYIDAAKIVCSKRDDVEFIAVGDGANFNNMLDRVGPDLKDKIKLLGRQYNVESFIKISDIGVLTTNSKVHGEGISNSILEYMALEKPVIASSGGGTNEIVEDQKTGFLISPANPEELSEKIEILLQDAVLRKKMGIAGKQRVINVFSIEKMVHNYISIYKDLLFERKKFLAIQRFVKKYIGKVIVKGWTIGIGRASIANMIRTKTFDPEITWLPIKSYDNFYADPFFFKAGDGNYNILFEDFNFREYYGKISLITLDKKFTPTHYETLIDTKKHASYPFIFKENDKLYVFPEISITGKLSCYEFDPVSKSLHFVKEIMDLPVLDPTILKYRDKYWLFGTHRGVDSDNKLYIYFADSLLGPYKPHPQNPVKDCIRSSRPAGNFIEVDGIIYRPSQNSETEYGGSITINRIRLLDENNFVEEPYFTIKINKKNKRNSGINSIHTINGADDLVIVDGGINTFSPLKKMKHYLSKKAYLSSLRKG